MPREQKSGTVVSKRRQLRDGLDATARPSARQAAARRLADGGASEDERAAEAACGVDTDDRAARRGTRPATSMPREMAGDGTRRAARKSRPDAGASAARSSDTDTRASATSRRTKASSGSGAAGMAKKPPLAGRASAAKKASGVTRTARKRG